MKMFYEFTPVEKTLLSITIDTLARGSQRVELEWSGISRYFSRVERPDKNEMLKGVKHFWNCVFNNEEKFHRPWARELALDILKRNDPEFHDFLIE